MEYLTRPFASMISKPAVLKVVAAANFWDSQAARKMMSAIAANSRVKFLDSVRAA
jgi:hypothetical protein